MRKYLLPALLTITLITSCFGSQSSGEKRSVLGFYSMPAEIIEKTDENKAGYSEHFMLGLAYKELRQYRKSVLHFANSAFVYHRNMKLRTFAAPVFQFMDEFHIKSDYFDDAAYEIAEIYHQYREFDYVVRFIDLMSKSPTALYRDAVVLKARALVELKEHDKALDALASRLPHYTNKGSLSLLYIRLASTYAGIPQYEKALNEYFKVLETDHRTWHSSIATSQILVLLNNEVRKLDTERKLLLGMSLYHGRKYDTAAALLEEALSAPDIGEEKNTALEYILKTFIRLDRSDKVRTTIDKVKKSNSYGNFLKIEADELWASGKRHAAITKYRILANQQSEHTRESLKRIVRYTEERKLPGFQNLLREYITRYPDDENTDLFAWLLTRSHIRDRDFISARTVIQSHLTRMPGGSYSDHLRFWLYKIHIMNGEHEAALSVLRDMSVKNPDSSYTWILLDSTARAISPRETLTKYKACRDSECGRLYHALLTLQDNNLKNRDKRINELSIPESRTYINLEKRIAGLELNSESAGTLRMIKKYFSVGYIEALNREIAILPDDNETKADINTALAHYAGKYDHHYYSAYSTIQLLNNLNLENNLMLMPQNTIKRLFPDAFSECVTRYSRQFKIDANLLYSVMRAESLYQHEAVSSAGATGLMQFMPSTARAVASQLGEKNFSLKDPCTSIKFGAHHLAWLNRAYKGGIELMVASYNAGPGNVQKWREKFPMDDIDLFTELVPFDETRYYILRTKKHLIQGKLVYNTGK